MTDETCLFCKIIAGEIPSDTVHEDDLIVAFNDINPVAPVHQLLVPRRHVESAAELSEADAGMLGRLFAVAARLAADAGLPEKGYRRRHQRRRRRWPVGAASALPPHRRTAHGLAARMTRAPGGWSLLAAAAMLAVGACTSTDRPTVQADAVAAAHAAALVRCLGRGRHRRSSRPPLADVGRAPRDRRPAPTGRPSRSRCCRRRGSSGVPSWPTPMTATWSSTRLPARGRGPGPRRGAGRTTSARASGRPTTRPTRSSR